MNIERTFSPFSAIEPRKRSNSSTPASVVEEWLNENPEKKLENKGGHGIARSQASSPLINGVNLTPAERKRLRDIAKEEGRIARQNVARREAAEKEKEKSYVALRRSKRSGILNQNHKLLIPSDKSSAKQMMDDINHLRKHNDINICVVTNVLHGGTYYLKDEVVEYQTDVQILTNTRRAGVEDRLIEVLKSHKLVRLDDFASTSTAARLTIGKIAKKHKLDVYVLKRGMSSVGFIMLPPAQK